MKLKQYLIPPLFPYSIIIVFAIVTFSQQAWSQATIQGTSTNTKVFAVQGTTGQTANLEEWNINGGSALGSISATGAATFAGLSLSGGNAISIANGGTGLTSTPSNGQLLIGNTTTNAYNLTTLNQGTGLSITNGAGSITLALSTPVSISNGGTNATTIGGAGSVIYSTGTQQASSAVGSTTAPQMLLSNGSAAPTWASPTNSIFSKSTTVYGTVSLSVPSTLTTYTLVPGLTTTIATTVTALFEIEATGGFTTSSTSLNGGSACDFAIFIDNSQPTNGGVTRVISDNASFSSTTRYFTLILSGSLAAGTHTIEIRARYAGGSTGTASSNNTSITQGTLMVNVFNQ